MASRTLSVALRALVQGYTGPMRAAAAATGPLEASLMRVQRAGDGLARVGSTLTRRVTLPLVAVGAVATKMALDFDKSFTTMQTLAGVTGDEVAGLKDRVLELAGETGRAPQELAEALYFLQSSGLDSAQAMEALEASAKASAVGLGDTATVADAVSSAMLAYAESGLTAAQATDVLIATARAGKAEPAELAGQMGRLLPIASELGITFADVGGAVAALSTKGNDAERSTTQLTNVMSKLLKPSQQAEQMLAGVGLSLDDVRAMIAERGLLGTLEELRSRLGESGFVKYFEDVQAVQGALSLLGGDLDQTRQIFDQVNNSVGVTDNAFGTWAKSMGAENAQAFAKFQVALIELGDAIAPIAADIAGFVAGIAEGFSDLPDPVQKFLLAIAGIAAVAGPLLSVGGRMAMTFSAIGSALSSLAVPAGTVSGAFNNTAVSTSRFTSALGGLTRATLVVGALITLREVLMAMDSDLEGIDVSTLENELLDLAETGKITGGQLKRVMEDFGEAIDSGDPQKIEAWSDKLGEVDKALAQLATRDPKAAAAAFREITDALEAQGGSADEVKGFFNDYVAAVAQADTTSRTSAGGIAGLTGGLEDQRDAAEDARTELEKYADALRAQFDPLFGMLDALRGNAEAQAAVVEATEAADKAVREHGEGSAEAAEAQATLAKAQADAALSALDVSTAMATLNDAIAKNPALLGDAKAQLQTWVDQNLISEETAAAMGRQFDITAMQATALGDTDPNVNVTETGGSRVRGTLSRVEQQAINLGRQKPNVRASATDNASNVLRRIFDNISRLKSKTVTITTVHRTLLSTSGAAESLRSTERRQHGGPVGAGRLYEVAEGRRAELLEMAGRTYLIPGSDGQVIPAGPMTSWSSAPAMATAGGGGRSTGELRITSSGGFAKLIHEEIRTGRVQLHVNGQKVRAG